MEEGIEKRQRREGRDKWPRGEERAEKGGLKKEKERGGLGREGTAHVRKRKEELKWPSRGVRAEK